MVGLCEGGNEPPGFLKAMPTQHRDPLGGYDRLRYLVTQTSYNCWGDHRANHTIPPFWLDDRPLLLRHVAVRPAAG
ncbi:hypothetical protein ANN_09277 [Periplaneta americana]|uniref:Uncharacterized protein n=1 Tax=Periplaneta americana TaxID=6978 RepID=A0ABQ8TN50_PERAM|nr:hypothetical protein ANN_09277 [Periplaneta americana]